MEKSLLDKFRKMSNRQKCDYYCLLGYNCYELELYQNAQLCFMKGIEYDKKLPLKIYVLLMLTLFKQQKTKETLKYKMIIDNKLSM